MYPAHRLARCAALMLTAAAPLAHALDAGAGAGSSVYAGAIDYAEAPTTVGAAGAGALGIGAPRDAGPGPRLKLHAGEWTWRDLAAGLSTRLEGGWTIAVKVTRAIGGASVYDRYNTGNLRADGRPWAAGGGRRAAVLSLTRAF
jgi:hypothetical protein